MTPSVREALEAAAGTIKVLGRNNPSAGIDMVLAQITEALAALAVERDAGEGDLREELQRVKRIAAHVPPLVWIQAKEHAGYADAVHPAARDGERGETRLCSECKGNSVVILRNERGSHAGTETCRACRGSGEAPAPPPVETPSKEPPEDWIHTAGCGYTVTGHLHNCSCYVQPWSPPVEAVRNDLGAVEAVERSGVPTQAVQWAIRDAWDAYERDAKEHGAENVNRDYFVCRAAEVIQALRARPGRT